MHTAWSLLTLNSVRRGCWNMGYKNLPPGGGNDAQWLGSTLLSWRTQVQFSGLTSGSSQMPLTPAPGDLMQSSGLLRHLHTQMRTHTHAHARMRPHICTNTNTPRCLKLPTLKLLYSPRAPVLLLNPSFRAHVCNLQETTHILGTISVQRVIRFPAELEEHHDSVG